MLRFQVIYVFMFMCRISKGNEGPTIKHSVCIRSIRFTSLDEVKEKGLEGLITILQTREQGYSAKWCIVRSNLVKFLIQPLQLNGLVIEKTISLSQLATSIVSLGDI